MVWYVLLRPATILKGPARGHFHLKKTLPILWRHWINKNTFVYRAVCQYWKLLTCPLWKIEFKKPYRRCVISKTPIKSEKSSIDVTNCAAIKASIDVKTNFHKKCFWQVVDVYFGNSFFSSLNHPQIEHNWNNQERSRYMFIYTY
jgi:hypothetical protein